MIFRKRSLKWKLKIEIQGSVSEDFGKIPGGRAGPDPTALTLTPNPHTNPA